MKYEEAKKKCMEMGLSELSFVLATSAYIDELAKSGTTLGAVTQQAAEIVLHDTVSIYNKAVEDCVAETRMSSADEWPTNTLTNMMKLKK